MQIKLWGFDFGPFVLAREILRKGGRGFFELHVKQSEEPNDDSFISESEIWDMAVRSIIQEKTRFGRVGIFIERKNTFALDYFAALDVSKYSYKQRNRRAEKVPNLQIFPTQVLAEMVNEGMEDSVEFRRLTRKFIRKAKNHHCDTLFFPDSIMGAEKAGKIIQHLAGTQLRCFFVPDWIEEFMGDKGIGIEKEGGIEFLIHSGDGVEFTRERGEGVLRVKLKKSTIK